MKLTYADFWGTEMKTPTAESVKPFAGKLRIKRNDWVERGQKNRMKLLILGLVRYLRYLENISL